MKRIFCRRLFGSLAACLFAAGLNVAQAQQIGPDVVGIKSGMTVKDAMQALKADNPRMKLSPSTLRLEGFSDDLMSYVVGAEPQTPGPPPGYTIARAGEKVTIAFTLPPNQESVWGVERVYNFATAERPALQVTLDALTKKYGPETTRLNAGPNSNHITWVYNAQGKPMGPGGAQLNKACTFPVLAAITGNPANDINNGTRWPADCNSVTIVSADISAGQDPASSQYVVVTMTVSVADAARYHAAMEATRAVVLKATKSREKTETDQVNQRKAPKL